MHIFSRRAFVQAARMGVAAFAYRSKASSEPFTLFLPRSMPCAAIAAAPWPWPWPSCIS
jgi:hypothetical protein